MPLLHPWLSQHILSIFNFLLTLTFVSFILRSKKPPGNTWAWLLFIVMAPYMGIPFYLIFSSRKFHTKFQKKEKPANFNVIRKTADTVEEILELLGAPTAKHNSETRVISNGESAYSEISQLIDSAQHSIHLVTFIFSKDAVGCSILSLLEKKVAQGVKVRILLDSFGSTWVNHPSFKTFKDRGGSIGYFMPLLHLPFKGRYNLRNHRKILVVDSQTAILGGMNIANEYMGPTEDDTRWIDIGLKITGPSAFDLDRIFSQDWAFATSEKIELPNLQFNKRPSEHLIQIVASGPDIAGDPIYDSLLTLIFRAKKRIWVSSPYFIPDESLATSLQLAAQRGIEVQVLVPSRSNHFLADLARESYLRQIVTAGAKVFFTEKMLHAKVFLIDGDYAVIGSANFDMRSLLYNFEVGAYISSKAEISLVDHWFTTRFRTSNENSISVLKRGFFRDILEGIGRVLGPMI